MNYQKTFATSFSRYMNGMAQDVCNKPKEYAKNFVMHERALEEQKSLLSALSTDPDNAAASWAISEAIEQERRILPKRIFVQKPLTEQDLVVAGCNGDVPKTTFVPKIVTNYYICPELRIKSRSAEDLIYFTKKVMGYDVPALCLKQAVNRLNANSKTKFKGVTVKVVGPRVYEDAESYKVVNSRNSGYNSHKRRAILDTKTGVTYSNGRAADRALGLPLGTAWLCSAHGFMKGRFQFVED